MLRSSFLPLTKKKQEITDNTKQSYTNVKWYSFCTPVCLHRFIPDNNSVFLCFTAAFSVYHYYYFQAPTTSETQHIFAIFSTLFFISFYFRAKLFVSFIIAGIILFFICFDTYTKIYTYVYILNELKVIGSSALIAIFQLQFFSKFISV